MTSVRTSILRMVANAYPQLFYGFPRTYKVAAVHSDKRLDLVPSNDAQHLQELKNVEQWSLAGVLVTPVVGAEVCVVFRDADPARPAVVNWGPVATPTGLRANASGTVTIGDGSTLVALGNGTELLAIGDETKRVVCYGDQVQLAVAGPLASGAIVQKVASAPNAIAKVSAQ